MNQREGSQQLDYLSLIAYLPHTSFAFGRPSHLAEATGSAKATAIRKLLKAGPRDPHWTLPSRMDPNRLAWIIQVNGLIMDARRLPREIQEEAFSKGLDPFHPG